MRTANDYLRDIRAGYPETVLDPEVDNITGEWVEALRAAEDGWELMFPILRRCVAASISEEGREARKESMRAQQEEAGNPGGSDDDSGFGGWARNTDSSQRRHERVRTRPYGNARKDRRTAHLAKSCVIDGYGLVAYADLTDEMLTARIGMYDNHLKSMKVHREYFVRERMYLRETDGAKTLGEAYALRGDAFAEPPADDLAA